MDSAMRSLIKLQQHIRRDAEKKRNVMSRTCRIVVERFRELGCNLPREDYFIHRTKSGRHQVAAGAWKWFLDSRGDTQARIIANRHGSGWQATEIARNPGKYSLYSGPGGVELL